MQLAIYTGVYLYTKLMFTHFDYRDMNAYMCSY